MTTYMPVYKQVVSWIRAEKLLVEYKDSINFDHYNALDGIILSVFGIEFDIHDPIRAIVQFQSDKFSDNIAWAYGPYAFTLFKARLIQLGYQ